ncbi:MAG: J domain-containing protein [Caldilineaceae bacterium]|nr:J domain-containing protein [Caldilineaceae bacterium]
MDYKDYYAILGLRRKASASDIKKAYRKMARKFHPDVNSGDAAAEQKFKEINEAYAVLSDGTKRRTYDKFGAQWKQYEQSGQNFDWSQWYNAGGAERQQGRTVSPEEFEQMFGGGGGSSFSDFFQQLFGGGPAQTRKGPRPSHQTSFGRPDGDQKIPVEISLEEAFCGTKRTIQQGSSRFEVTIPAGVKTGSKVRAGDLIMTVAVQPHKEFVMDGNDLHAKAPVDLYDALLGGEVHVNTLQGAVALTIPADTQNGQVFRLKGQGMPDLKNNKERGDLLVEVVVELPVPLSVEARRFIETLQRASSE